jgi:hypothetical protein
MFGYKVEAHDRFAAVGSPNPQHVGQQGTGSVDVYRYDASKGTYSYYGTTQTLRAYGTSGTGGTSGTAGGGVAINYDGYGLSFDLYNRVLAVGDPYFSGSYDGVTQIEESYVDIYLLNPTSSIVQNLYTAQKINTTIPSSIDYFGGSVSINSDYIVVGAKNTGASNEGSVYIYSYTTGSNTFNYNASAIKIDGLISNRYFGSEVRIDKGGSNTILIAESSSVENPKVFLYTSSSAGWYRSHTFTSITGSIDLPFDDIASYNYVKNSYDQFGKSIQINKDTVVIGAPKDASYYEYSGSTIKYNRGSVYVYGRVDCPTDYTDLSNTGSIYYQQSQSYWDLMDKYIGDENTIKGNQLGCSVDVWNNNIIVGCISSSIDFCTKSNISSSVSQSFSDYPIYNGQYILLDRTGSSVSSVTYDYKKKLVGYSYMSYGYDVAISDKSIVIGSPLIINDFTSSNTFTVSPSVPLTVMDHIKGHVYFSTLSSLRTDYHAGNVFYRNGEIIFSNTGSQFTEILKTLDDDEYEYDLSYKSKYTINEKSVICVVDTGEFNISTNPTALDETRPGFDLMGNREVDFRDVNLILLYIVDINTPGNPNFATDDTFWDEYVIETSAERSIFEYYKTYYGYGPTTLKSQYATYKSQLIDLESQFDFDGDGKVSINDAKIFWKFFIGSLRIDNYNLLINPLSTRKTLSDVVSYIISKTSKYVNTNGIPSIKSTFLDYQESSSLDITGSYLAPYITTIGLYSGSDLVAVAKLSSPIKNGGEYPLNFLVKWDV